MRTIKALAPTAGVAMSAMLSVIPPRPPISTLAAAPESRSSGHSASFQTSPKSNP